MQHNELVIDDVRTSSFNFDILIEEAPSYHFAESKSQLIEHQGVSGAVMQSNPHRSTITKTYTIQMFNPTERQINEFSALLRREKFWLENEQVKETRLWCYKVESGEILQERPGYFVMKASFICHPTRYMRQFDKQTLTTSGTLRTQGAALAFPTITINGNSATETHFTVGDKTIRLKSLTSKAVMVNEASQPSFKDAKGQPVEWRGDFLTINPLNKQNIGVVLGPGITSIIFETNWGW